MVLEKLPLDCPDSEALADVRQNDPVGSNVRRQECCLEKFP
jgi:hypothetical protein